MNTFVTHNLISSTAPLLYRQAGVQCLELPRKCLPGVSYGLNAAFVVNGTMLCMLAAPRVQFSVSAGIGWPRYVLLNTIC